MWPFVRGQHLAAGQTTDSHIRDAEIMSWCPHQRDSVTPCVTSLLVSRLCIRDRPEFQPHLATVAPLSGDGAGVTCHVSPGHIRHWRHEAPSIQINVVHGFLVFKWVVW